MLRNACGGEKLLLRRFARFSRYLMHEYFKDLLFNHFLQFKEVLCNFIIPYGILKRNVFVFLTMNCIKMD